MSSVPGTSEVLAEVLAMLADLTGDPAVLGAAPGTPLLRDGVGLDSVAAALLLTRVRARFGVDVAGDDLNLDSLATIGTLAAFVSDRLAGAQRRAMP